MSRNHHWREKKHHYSEIVGPFVLDGYAAKPIDRIQAGYGISSAIRLRSDLQLRSWRQDVESIGCGIVQSGLIPPCEWWIRFHPLFIYHRVIQDGEGHGLCAVATDLLMLSCRILTLPLLTIGLPTYDDFDGVYFTIQALRMYQDLKDVELLVVDNFGCNATRNFIAGLPEARYERFVSPTGTAVAKNFVFAHATGDVVLCIDSHVLLAPDAIAQFTEYCLANPPSRNLLHGPLWLDDLHTTGVATHLSSIWSEGMHGQWATDPRGVRPDAPPFEIPSQGMGLFAHCRVTWPGFNPLFRGFGGEEGYLQEKVRQQGGQVLCLPFLRWAHRFQRPHGTPYKVRTWDKFRNALIGHIELGLDPRSMVDHFSTLLPCDVLEQVISSVQDDLRDGDVSDSSKIIARVKELVGETQAAGLLPDVETTLDESPPRG
jgi:hypothetical protein